MKPFIMPVNKPYKITSYYDYRPNPFNPAKVQFHDGIDVVTVRENGEANAEDVLLAIGDGVIILDFDEYIPELAFKDIKHSLGNYMIIQHDVNGEVFFSRYAHVKENYVNHGQYVTKGQQVGVYADVGKSKGGHVHLNLYRGKNWTKVNPLDYIEG